MACSWNIVVIALLTLSAAVRAIDLTTECGAFGTDVVLATISKLEAAQIFESDMRLLRRIAYVETDDGRLASVIGSGSGENNHSSANNIWNVDSINLLRTTTDMILADKRMEIAAKFPEVGEWEFVVWEDLSRPLWSALAARLVLFLAENITTMALPNTGNITAQALFWKQYYNTGGDVVEFETRVDELEEDEICRVKSDIIFVLDSSGSVKKQNYTKMIEFAYNFVESLDISPTETQVGVIIFSDIATVIFNLSTYSEKQPLLDAINNIPYKKGYTNIADALCVLIHEGFTEEGGARLSADDVFHIAIVLTDGESNRNSTRCDNATTFEAVELVQNFLSSIIIFSIGITAGVNDDELHAIATRDDYVTYLDDFSQSAFADVRYKQFYELCSKSAITKDVNSSLSGSLVKGGQVRYEFEIPPQGLFLNICVSQGGIELYGSSVITNPNSALHDVMLIVTAGNESMTVCMNLTIENSNNTSIDSNDTNSLYIALEGTQLENNYTLVITEAEPSPSPTDDNDDSTGQPDVNPKEERDCFGSSCTFVIVLVVVIISIAISVLAACAMCLAVAREKKRKRKRKKRNQIGVIQDHDNMSETQPSNETHQL